MRLFAKRGQAGRALATRSRVVRSFVPCAEHLDPRELLAAGPLGINVSGSLDFVDAMKNAQGWFQNGSAPLTLDGNGWPTSDATVLVTDQRVNQSWNGPDNNAVQPDIGGTYSLSFQGQATVTPPGWLQIFSVQNQVYNAQTNTTTAQVVVVHNAYAFLEINFSNTVDTASATGAGVSNVQLIKPGYAANTTQVFTNNYLNALGPFGEIRYLNVDEANSFGATVGSNGQLAQLSWSQRTLPSYASQAYASDGNTQGVAWEYMVALANATNTDMWINVPGPATNDYVTHLANLINNGDTVAGVTYAGLKPNLKVYLEYSNEVWGGIPNPTAYNNAAAKQEVANGGSVLNNDGSTTPGTWANRYYLEREMQITNIFRGVMGADPTYSRIRPVLGWQEGNTDYYRQVFPWFDGTFGAPSSYFYGMGNANYFGPSDYSSVNAVLSTLAANEAQTYQTTTRFATVASYYGLKVVAYEGGPAIGSSSNTTTEANALAASRDPRVEAIIEQEYLDWYAAGGNEAMYFDGPYDTLSPQNEWAIAELAQASNPSLSPRYRAAQDVVAAAPVAVTAGTLVTSTGPTSLPLTIDSLDWTFTNPHTGFVNFWLLNVPSAGTYNLTLTTDAYMGNPSQYAPGTIQVSLNDQQISTDSVTGGQSFSLGLLTLKAGLNTVSIQTIHGLYDPGNANPNYYPFSPNALTLTPAVQVEGVTSPGFSSTGFLINNAGVDVAPAGNATSTATYTFNVTPGLYRVSASWPASAGNAIDVPVTILDGSNQVGYLTVNQQAAPSGFSDGTTTWQDLGGPYTVLGSTLTITLSNAPDGLAVAPTIRIQQTVATGAGVIANVNSQFFTEPSGTWNHFGDYVTDPTGSYMTTPAGNGSSVGDFTFRITPGLYKVSAIWQTLAGLSSAVPFTIFDGTKILAVVPVNQSIKPNGYNDGSINWQDLGGPYNITSGVLMIQINSVSDGAAEAQAVRFQSIPKVTTPPAPGLVYGVGGPALTETGTWSHLAGDDETSASATNATATWTVPVAPGTYRVSTTWPTGSNQSTSATYQVGQLVAGSGAPSNAPSVGDSGFEAIQIGSGNYSYGPTGSPWTFSGGAGLTGNGSGFTSGNPAAPQGAQVAFLQAQGVITQTIANWSAGTYQLSFLAAQRGNAGPSSETFEVLVDGKVVSTFTPVGTAYQSETTASFTVAAGSHTVTLQGMTTADNTVLLDNVSVVSQNAPPATPSVGDSSFETVAVGAGNYRYSPTGSPWTFSGGAGLTGNGSGFTSGNPAAPQGAQVAFLQAQGVITQTIANWSAGTYQLSFLAAQRGNAGPSSETFEVLVDGKVVSTFTPSGTAYQSETTASFTVAAGSHTVTLQGMTTADNTVLLDNVSVVSQNAPPATPSVGDSSFETVAVGAGNYRYSPTGSPWTFSGGAGLTGNGSGFTSGNPAAPQGAQVAFLQAQGVITQTIANWSAGTYQLSFLAAQRGNAGPSSETFEVLVDGKVVSTFTPSGTAYQSETTASFTVAAGSHTVSFQGMTTADNTVLLDNVSISGQTNGGSGTTVQPLGSATFNQTQTPASFLETGINWQDLGTFTVTGSALVVQLNNSTTGATEARAVRIQRLS